MPTHVPKKNKKSQSASRHPPSNKNKLKMKKSQKKRSQNPKKITNSLHRKSNVCNFKTTVLKLTNPNK